MDPWALLKVVPGDTEADLSRNYRRLMFKAHPDRGGDERRAKVLTAAYEELKKFLKNGRLLKPDSVPLVAAQPMQHGVVIIINVGRSPWRTNPTTTGNWDTSGGWRPW